MGYLEYTSLPRVFGVVCGVLMKTFMENHNETTKMNIILFDGMNI